jgi:uncharacterized membrane protein
MTTTVDRLIEDYLDRLEQELADVPQARRRELVSEISDHIAEGRAEARTEAEVRTLLDRLGEPAEIADEARERFPQSPRPSRTFEICALVALSAGAVFLPVVGPLAGITLLWFSSVWTVADKVKASIIVLAACGLAAWYAVSGDLFGLVEAALLGISLGSLVASVYLGLRLRTL